MLNGISGQRLGNRQIEELTQCAAADFDQFYTQRPRHLTQPRSPVGVVAVSEDQHNHYAHVLNQHKHLVVG